MVLIGMHMCIFFWYFCATLVLHVDIHGSAKRYKLNGCVCVCFCANSPLNKVVITSCYNIVNFHIVSDNMVELKASGTEATAGTHY
jgi:hypothetical protein